MFVGSLVSAAFIAWLQLDAAVVAAVVVAADAAADAAAVAVVSRTTCSEGLGLWTVVVAVASSALHCQS